MQTNKLFTSFEIGILTIRDSNYRRYLLSFNPRLLRSLIMESCRLSLDPLIRLEITQAEAVQR